MRKTALRVVHELAQQDDRVVFIGSDLGVGTLNEFKEEFPDRYFSDGISEAHLVGVAAGMAMEGKIPYLNTIATFISRRALEQVVLDVALHKAKVRLIANGGGLVYAPLGPTHQAIDDLASMGAIPGMGVLAPADAVEMEQLMRQTLHHEGPLYIRLGKGHDPVVTEAYPEARIGEGRVLAEGKDVALITTGVCCQPSLLAAKDLREKGIAASVVHFPTVVPLDRKLVLQTLGAHELVLTVEEHVMEGGLGSRVAMVLAESDSRPRFKALAIQGGFQKRYGSQAALMSDSGLSGEGIASTVMEMLSGDEA